MHALRASRLTRSRVTRHSSQLTTHSSQLTTRSLRGASFQSNAESLWAVVPLRHRQTLCIAVATLCVTVHPFVSRLTHSRECQGACQEQERAGGLTCFWS